MAVNELVFDIFLQLLLSGLHCPATLQQCAGLQKEASPCFVPALLHFPILSAQKLRYMNLTLMWFHRFFMCLLYSSWLFSVMSTNGFAHLPTGGFLLLSLAAPLKHLSKSLLFIIVNDVTRYIQFIVFWKVIDTSALVKVSLCILVTAFWTLDL